MIARHSMSINLCQFLMKFQDHTIFHFSVFDSDNELFTIDFSKCQIVIVSKINNCKKQE